MDPDLLRYYDTELKHLRERTQEFAEEFPKKAQYLSLNEFDVADPYVERLLEGFAYLAARVQLKIDSEHTQFTHSLLETIYPHFLAPTPSMTVVQFQPDPAEEMNAGYSIPRGTRLRVSIPEMRTPCEFRTGHDVHLWPIEIQQVEYVSRGLSALDLPDTPDRIRAALRIRLRTNTNIPFRDLEVNRLTFFMQEELDRAGLLYENLFAHVRGVLAGSPEKGGRPRYYAGKDSLRQVGFSDPEALLPHPARSFQGYRLLQEYFACPRRFMFFEIGDIREAVRECAGPEFEIIVLLQEDDPDLEKQVKTDSLTLFAAPVINLFPKRADRIALADRSSEHLVVPDRTRLLDYEIFRIDSVTGHGLRAGEDTTFTPFFSRGSEAAAYGGGAAHFTVHRVQRRLTQREQEQGRRSKGLRGDVAGYGGSDVYLMLVDTLAPPVRADLRELSVETLCTNRDLPLFLKAKEDFTAPDLAAPVRSITSLFRPTTPLESRGVGNKAWNLVSHLSLNYLSLVNSGEREKSPAALHDMLLLYGDPKKPEFRKKVEGLLSVEAKTSTARLPPPGPLAFARGLDVTLTFDEEAFEGDSAFLLGSVLDRFLARHVSINSFTRTTVCTRQKDFRIQWPARLGLQSIL